MKDDHGQSRGFGFVCFESPEDAKKAVQAMNGVTLGSKIIYAGRAQKKNERKLMLTQQFEERRRQYIMKFQGSNVYVKNLNEFVDDNELRKHFSSFGEVISAKVMRTDEGFSKGFGFVCFSTPEAAKKAIISLNGSKFYDRRLYVAVAQSKEERQAMKARFAPNRLPFISYPSYPTPHHYSSADAFSQCNLYPQHQNFVESQLALLPGNCRQQGNDATFVHMVSGLQRQIRNWMNHLPLQYSQQSQFLPWPQYLIHPVNIFGNQDKQLLTFQGAENSERGLPHLKNMNKPRTTSGLPYQGYGASKINFTGATSQYQMRSK